MRSSTPIARPVLRLAALAGVFAVLAGLLTAACGESIEATAELKPPPEGPTSVADDAGSGDAEEDDGTEPQASGNADDPDLDPAAVLDLAATASAGRPVITTTTSVTADDELVNRSVMTTVAAEGVGRGTVEVPMMGELEMLLLPEGVYFSFPDLPPGREWVLMDLAGMHELTGVDLAATQVDPLQAVVLPSEIGADLHVVGSEDLDGVEVTRYRMTAALGDLLDALVDTGVFPDDGSIDAMFGEPTVIDLLVDGDGLLRGQSYEMELPEGPGGKTVTLGYELRYDYPDEPPLVVAPPPETVLALDELLAFGG